jgi:hypothetical protein
MLLPFAMSLSFLSLLWSHRNGVSFVIHNARTSGRRLTLHGPAFSNRRQSSFHGPTDGIAQLFCCPRLELVTNRDYGGFSSISLSLVVAFSIVLSQASAHHLICSNPKLLACCYNGGVVVFADSQLHRVTSTTTEARVAPMHAPQANAQGMGYRHCSFIRWTAARNRRRCDSLRALWRIAVRHPMVSISFMLHLLCERIDANYLADFIRLPFAFNICCGVRGVRGG